MNYRFDLDAWLPRFPLEAEIGRYNAQLVTSPWHLCQNEHLRREMQGEYDWGSPVPMDVFVMADGEPTHRHATKIGGLPYRLASMAWPTLPGNIPLVFLAQVNFCDSRDLTGKLPGDVLVIFADNPYIPSYLHFEWQPLGLAGPMQTESVPVPLDEVELDALRRDKKRFGPIAVALGRLGLEVPDEIPHPTKSFEPCYGHLFRTASFPEAVPHDEESTGPTCRGLEVSSEWALLCYQATQVGEAPLSIQEGDSIELPGRLLCTVSSVQPEVHRPYPWINHPSALQSEGRWDLDDKHLMIGDMGCIYISLTDDGELHWHSSSY